MSSLYNEWLLLRFHRTAILTVSKIRIQRRIITFKVEIVPQLHQRQLSWTV